MFRNRWGALLFVALTLAGVTRLVGSEDGDGAIQQATDRLGRQKAEAGQLTSDARQTPSAASTAAETVVLSADEELIDPATGDDPTPADEFGQAGQPDPDAEMPDDGAIVAGE